MKRTKYLAAIVFTLCTLTASAQFKFSANDVEPDKDYENIHVQKLNSDSLATSFIIWIKKSVKKHKHVEHTENIYVLEGEAEMILGDKKIKVKGGDFINIPKNTAHAVTVTSKNPLKVISIQSPNFDGSDRVFID